MSSQRGTILLGHPRSGTTLLRRLLNAHPEIVAPPETHLFGACARFIRSQATADGVDLGVLAGLDFVGIPDAVVLEKIANLAFDLMDDVTQRAGKSQWVEKTAFDAFEIDGIELICADDVRYLGIVRHPLDVALSTKGFCDAAGIYPHALHEFIQRHPAPIEAFVHSWIHVTDALVGLGERRNDQVMIIRYEDLVSHTEETMSDVVEFMGHPPNIGFLTRALEGLDDLGFSDHKSYTVTDVHRNSVATWRDLPSFQIGQLAPLINPYLVMLGYEPIIESEAPKPSVGRARYLKSLALHAASQDHDLLRDA